MNARQAAEQMREAAAQVADRAEGFHLRASGPQIAMAINVVAEQIRALPLPVLEPDEAMVETMARAIESEIDLVEAVSASPDRIRRMRAVRIARAAVRAMGGRDE